MSATARREEVKGGLRRHASGLAPGGDAGAFLAGKPDAAYSSLRCVIMTRICACHRRKMARAKARRGDDCRFRGVGETRCANPETARRRRHTGPFSRSEIRPPAVRDQTGQNRVDRFILAKPEAADKDRRPTDPRTLIRRMTMIHRPPQRRRKRRHSSANTNHRSPITDTHHLHVDRLLSSSAHGAVGPQMARCRSPRTPGDNWITAPLAWRAAITSSTHLIGTNLTSPIREQIAGMSSQTRCCATAPRFARALRRMRHRHRLSLPGATFRRGQR